MPYRREIRHRAQVLVAAADRPGKRDGIRAIALALDSQDLTLTWEIGRVAEALMVARSEQDFAIGVALMAWALGADPMIPDYSELAHIARKRRLELAP